MWHPSVTVAAIIEHNDKFILVSDKTPTGIKLNQPAGHLDPHETLIEAVIREVKEETSLDFIPQKIVGIYMMPANDEITYLRFCFKGILSDYNAAPSPMEQDLDVVEAKWYSIDEIKQLKHMHRSMIVDECFNDYLNGQEYPLELIKNFMAQNI